MDEAPVRYALGIDLGGTNTVVAIVSDGGKVVNRKSISTRNYKDVERFMKKVSETARELMTESGLSGKIEGVGIGAPCLNASTGCIEAATDLPWPSPIALRELTESCLGLRCVAVNDANAAAAGEAAFGAARGMRNFVMLTLGTGVGGGVMCDGHLLSGRSGFAAELGHIEVVRGEGRLCSCGRRDCLQTYCSASGVVETACRLLKESPDRSSSLRALDETGLSAAAIAEAAREGDELALEVWKITGERLGEACASYAAFADPEAFLFFGGVAGGFPYFSQALKESFDRNALHLYRGKVAMLPSDMKDSDAALLGAASLIFQSCTS